MNVARTAVLITFLLIPMMGIRRTRVRLLGATCRADPVAARRRCRRTRYRARMRRGRDRHAAEPRRPPADAFVSQKRRHPRRAAPRRSRSTSLGRPVEVVAAAEFPHFLGLADRRRRGSVLHTVRTELQRRSGTNGESAATVVPFAIGECSVPTSGTAARSHGSPSTTPTVRGPSLADSAGSTTEPRPASRTSHSVTSRRSRPATPANASLTDAELAAAAAQIGCSLSTIPKSYKTHHREAVLLLRRPHHARSRLRARQRV